MNNNDIYYEKFAKKDKAVYVCDVNFMEQFSVREPFERFGGAAFFNKNRQIVGWLHLFCFFICVMPTACFCMSTSANVCSN